MAWYTITYACGHTDRIQLYGPEKDRQRKIEWLEENLCHECEKKANEERAKQQAVELNLPELEGSEKQVAWAMQIRSTAVKEKIEYGEVLETLENEFGETDELDEAIDTIMGEADSYQFCQQTALEQIKAQKSAKWYIDNRQYINRRLTALVAESIATRIRKILNVQQPEKQPEQKEIEYVTVAKKRWGKCKNGSYYIITIGCLNDYEVKTQLAFVKEGIENQDGTLTVDDEKLSVALWQAGKRTAECNPKLEGVTVSYYGVEQPRAEIDPKKDFIGFLSQTIGVDKI